MGERHLLGIVFGLVVLVATLTGCAAAGAGGSSNSSDTSDPPQMQMVEPSDVYTGSIDETPNDGMQDDDGGASVLLKVEGDEIQGTLFVGSDDFELTGTLSALEAAPIDGSVTGTLSGSGSLDGSTLTIHLSGTITEVDSGETHAEDFRVTATLLPDKSTSFQTWVSSANTQGFGPQASMTNPSVEEFVIGSADLLAFSYDEVDEHWNTTAFDNYQNGTTSYYDMYENDMVQSVESLKFTPSDPTIAGLNPLQLPDTADIVYFDNEWHATKIDGSWYGDVGGRYPDVSNGFSWIDLDENDEATREEVYQEFDVVFVNRSIINEVVLVRRTADDLGEDFSGNYAGDTIKFLSGESAHKAAIEKVFDQVRHPEWEYGYALFVPMDPIDISAADGIVVVLDMAGLVAEVTEAPQEFHDDYGVDYGLRFSLDANGAPLTYAIETYTF